nr:rRNA biogenesis protein RRP36-like [Aegilops tauschii subsp. strangulata]
MRLASWINKGLDWALSDKVMTLQKRVKSMMEKNTSLADVIQRFFGMPHEEIWKLLFNAQKTWPETTKDLGLDCAHPATPAPEKKGKEARSGLCRKGTSDIASEDTEALPSHEGDEDEEEEEESNSPLKGGKKKIGASVDLEAEASKTGKISLSDYSESDAKAVPEWHPRPKPLAEFPARDLPQQSSSFRNSLAPEMMESETPPRASPPHAADDTEVLSQRTSPGQREVQKAAETTPEASAKDAEVSELQRKLKLAGDEIDRINKRFDEDQGTATEVETLKSALAEAKEEARASKAAANKAAAEVEPEKVARRKYKERVTEVEQALQDAANKCESLEESNKAQGAELTKAL